MGVAERRLRQKAAVRKGILDAARQLVKTEGWEALSIRKIADAIEYSVPVVYEHFENKEAILFELSLCGFKLQKKKLDTAINSRHTPEVQLRELVYAYWGFAFGNRQYYKLMYGLGMPCSGTGKLKPEVNAFCELACTIVRRMEHKRNADQQELDVKIRSLWSFLHGLISIMLMRTSDIDGNMNENVMRESTEGFLRYL